MPKQYSPARVWWNLLYRKYRIARREATKATMDMVLYGQGVVRVGPDVCEHVPLHQFLRE